MEADFAGRITGDFQPVHGGIGAIADRIVAIAAREAVGIVAALADQQVIAQPALQKVVSGIAGQHVIGKAGRARQQVCRGPHRAVGKADLLDLARTQCVLNGDPRAG